MKRIHNEQDERINLEARSLDLSVSCKEGGDPDDHPTENARVLRPNNVSKN